ncbi:MAG: protein kinase domain-containing protein [Gemmatirosa sp.]
MATLGHEHLFGQEFPALADALRGPFKVQRELGRGGMRKRFLREARTAARPAHPNIVPVYRADEVGGSAYFAMAFIDGESLAGRVRDRGPLPAADAVPILRDVAWALAYAHARGVVHRDVKPEDILPWGSRRWV